MGILYFISSLLLVGITFICVIVYVIKTRKYHFLWIIAALIILLYSANELYNFYRVCQMPHLTPLSFRQVSAEEISRVMPYNKNYPVYILEFTSNKKMEDFSRAPQIVFLSPYIEKKDYHSILKMGKDSIFESISIYPSKKTNRYDYIVIFQHDNEYSMNPIDIFQSHSIIYFKLFFIDYLAPIYGTSSISVPKLDVYSRDSNVLFLDKYKIPQ